MKSKTISAFLYLILSISGLVFAESDQMFMVDLGPLPKGLGKPPVALSQINNQAFRKFSS